MWVKTIPRLHQPDGRRERVTGRTKMFGNLVRMSCRLWRAVLEFSSPKKSLKMQFSIQAVMLLHKLSTLSAAGVKVPEHLERELETLSGLLQHELLDASLKMFPPEVLYGGSISPHLTIFFL